MTNPRRPQEGQSLADLNPGLASQWHPTRNEVLEPNAVMVTSGITVWWMCERGHEWRAVVANRSGGAGCRKCWLDSRALPGEGQSLADKYPEIAAQWHPSKNGDLKPSQVSYGSKRNLWWICKKRHEWQSRVDHRSSGTGCPTCNERPTSALSITEPRWHPTKNSRCSKSDFGNYSSHKVWWVCSRGHEWLARIGSVASGSGCPTCAISAKRKPRPGHSLAEVYPDLVPYWHATRNLSLTPFDVMPGSDMVVWWKCPAGHASRRKVASVRPQYKCMKCRHRKVSIRRTR